MCFGKRVVKQLARLPWLDYSRVALDNQMKILFRTVFNQRIKAEWKEPEKRQIADLLRLNDLTLRNGYRYRLDCSQNIVLNTMVMRSAAEFLIKDFPDETQPLSESVYWGDGLISDRYHNIHDNVDLYNEYWDNPDWQPMVDIEQVPSDHDWWNTFRARYLCPDQFKREFEPREYYAKHEDEIYYPVDDEDIPPVEVYWQSRFDDIEYLTAPDRDETKQEQ